MLAEMRKKKKYMEQGKLAKQMQGRVRKGPREEAMPAREICFN